MVDTSLTKCTNSFVDRGAELTIIAASGTGPDHGLPGISTARAPRSTLTIGNHIFMAVEHPGRQIGSSKWSTRGWTYQEVLLSARRLVFTDTQVYFQCKSAYMLEGWGKQQKELSRNSRLMLAAFPEISGISRASGVYNRLEEYYRRELSYQSDILNAFTNNHGSVGFSAFPGITLHLHDPPESIHGKLMAICAGNVSGEFTSASPVVIVVEEIGTETGTIREYRHVGVCSWSMGSVGKALQINLFDLEVMSKGVPWHRETLRLV